MSDTPHENPRDQIRYDVNENPPPGLSVLLACQTVLLILAGIVLTPAIVLRAAGMPPEIEPMVIFFALAVSGAVTVLQARKVWRFGSGYILLMGTSGAFIAVGVTALKSGGLPLLMTLIVVSALVQFVFANNLGLLRRLITPLVGGTAIMLIAVTVMPIVFKHFSGTTPGELIPAGITLCAILFLAFFGSPGLRLWAPIIGVVLGSLVCMGFGTLDLSRVGQAAWIGVPELAWPGFDLSFGREFWVLLPAFALVTIVGAIETYGDAIAIQHLSHRKEKPVDFRVVQGALYADGLGNLLSGIFGTLPNTTYSTSISVVDMTGVAARRVGLFCGVIMVILAFFPKITALLLSIPMPVVGSYLLVLIILLFMHGLRMVVAEGLDYEKGLIVGMGFWLGTGFQHNLVFPELIPAWLAPILNNGMTSGTLTVLVLVWLINLRQGKTARLETDFTVNNLGEVNAFIAGFARKNQWDSAVLHRIQLAAEEVILGMGEQGESRKPLSRLRLELRKTDTCLEMDLATASVDQNIEILIDAARMSDEPAMSDLSFRILGGLAHGIRHYQFHGLDYICLKIKI